MATKIVSLMVFISFSSSIFSTAQSKNGCGNIKWWCNTTPHPEPCKYFMSHSHQRFAPDHKSDFRRMLVQVAMDRALHGQRQVLRSGSNCVNKWQKGALNDCLKLYEDTVYQLNQTLQGLHGNQSCSDFDAQTWLSTAFTNLETCQDSAKDLNVTNFIFPLMSNNVSELISNSLAINDGLMEGTSYRGGFPSWVSAGERKLLQSTSLATSANLVVAKDGSGDFSSIQAAINAAAKRTSSGRFIIYVKKGLYRENIEVGINVNNITLVGDGMKKTIITGSRSVRGGYTTYNSATAGKTSFVSLSPFDKYIIKEKGLVRVPKCTFLVIMKKILSQIVSPIYFYGRIIYTLIPWSHSFVLLFNSLDLIIYIQWFKSFV